MIDKTTQAFVTTLKQRDSLVKAARDFLNTYAIDNSKQVPELQLAYHKLDETVRNIILQSLNDSDPGTKN